ncbi:MAG: permease [Synergistetes bacterium]|nr:permease [Synergistota bacterium]MDW8192381.1 permease [Synergistota bacterium]
MNLKAQIVILFLTLFFYVWALIRDRGKVKKASSRGLKNLLRNSIRILSIFIIIGILQSFLAEGTVGKFLMSFSGIKGILIGTFVGAIMMGPVISGYPICRYLLDHGASFGLISSFLFSWVMVGVISIPIELKNFGGRFTLLRNSFALISAIILALIMEVLL